MHFTRGSYTRVFCPCVLRVPRDFESAIHGVYREEASAGKGLNIQNIAHKSKYSNIAELSRYVIYLYFVA